MDEIESRVSSTYEVLLNECELSPKHLANLELRGLSVDLIHQAQYKTMPMKRQAIVEKCCEDQSVQGVPGFWKNQNGRWMLAGESGMIVPVRNVLGDITGLKIRSDRKETIGKYTQLSSNPKKDKDGNSKYPFGTKAKIAVHYPIFGRPNGPIKKLRITEGELKADVASALGDNDTYTISLPGVTMWAWAFEAIEALKPELVVLSFDSDKDKEYSSSTPSAKEPYEVARCLASLYMGLKEKDIKVKIEHWEAEFGKGIDDVLAQGFSDKLRYFTNDEAREFCTKNLRGNMPIEWIYIVGTKRFINTVTMQELDKEQFSDKLAHHYKGRKAADVALMHPGFPKVDRPIYQPNQPQVIQAPNDQKLFNFWKPSPVKREDGSIKKFEDHANYIIPDEIERNIYLDWMAYNIQNPGSKIHWATLLQGIPGTGKSYFGYAMRKVLGEHNVSNPSNEELHEKYTGWQKSCQLVIIEELMARGRLELMNKLKPMITQDIAVVREMYKPSYPQPNCFNLQLFTNYEDAIIIDEHDRRYFVYFSPAKPRSHKYYQELWAWTDSHAGRILSYLQDRDLKEFIAKGHAPMTDSKRKIVGDSLPPLEQWIKEGIEDQAWPFHGDLISTRHLMRCIPRNVKFVNLTILGKALRKFGAQELKRVKLSNNESVTLLSVRKHEIYESASGSYLINEYERWSADREPGGNPLKDAEPI